LVAPIDLNLRKGYIRTPMMGPTSQGICVTYFGITAPVLSCVKTW
jgi:hypothetical protein